MFRKFWYLLLFCFLILPASITAAGDFQIDLHDKYSFSKLGSCQIISQVSLTNLRSDTYASTYQLIFRGSPPQNISGKDSHGPLNINVNSDGINSIFDITFNEPVIGKNSTQIFSLSYSCPEAVSKGQIWDINLPKLSNPETIYSYNLELEVPSEFGKPAYMFPTPVFSGNNIYKFTKGQLLESGVISSFGNFQTYAFSIEYPLQNPTNKSQNISVAIPADTSYQKVQYTDIQPPPLMVSVDSDGNWLASFNVPSKTDITATASGRVNVYPSPFSPPDPLNEEQLEAYLKPSVIWQTEEQSIRDLAKKYSTPGDIYNFVTDTLSYDYSKATGSSNVREGALFALSNPGNSLCTEFTDLFIAISRAAGIPAREIEGFGYSSDAKTHPLDLRQSLHAWPEYWDRNLQTWVGVDPTWEKTGKIDYFSQLGFEHVAIAIHGKNYPEPYLTSKNISLKFSEYKEPTESPLEITWNKPYQVIPFYSLPSQIVIKNTQGHAVYKTFFTINSDLFVPDSEIHKFVSVIPPYGVVNIPVSFKSSFLPDLEPHILSISNSIQAVKYNIPRNLFIGWYVCFASICALSLIFLAGTAIRSRSLFIQRRRTKNNLRR